MNKLLQKEMNAGNSCLIQRISIFLLFVLFVTAHSFAQNTTISSGKFSDPAIWSDNTMPAPNDMVIIKAGNIIEFDTIATIDRLTIENGATLLIKNQHRITISNALTINGRLEVVTNR
jgi:hypothetical protein